ncbi:hypothetical protein ACWD9K_16965 [Streptomyces sp. 900116325]
MNTSPPSETNAAGSSASISFHRCGQQSQPSWPPRRRTARPTSSGALLSLIARSPS